MPKDASLESRRSRYLTLLLVIALHGVVLAGLLIAAKSRPPRIAATVPLEIVFLPRELEPRTLPLPRATDRAPVVSKTPTRSPTATEADSSLVTVPIGATPAPRVDWVQEAHIVAAERAHPEPPAPIPHLKSETGAKSVFAPSPAHHRGDEVALERGGTAVYVSEDCYVVAPNIPVVQNATNNGMGLQRYCDSKSDATRGDLFDQLSDYKKLHPEH